MSKNILKCPKLSDKTEKTLKNVCVAKIPQFWYTRGVMIKTIDVAGIELDNYTVRETIMNVEKKMSDSGFHTIEEDAAPCPQISVAVYPLSGLHEAAVSPSGWWHSV